MLRCHIYSSTHFYADVLQEEEGVMQPGIKPDARSTDKAPREEGRQVWSLFYHLFSYTYTEEEWDA